MISTARCNMLRKMHCPVHRASTQSNEDPNALLHWQKLDSSFRHADQIGRVISEQEEEKEGEKKEEENTTCNFLADT